MATLLSRRAAPREQQKLPGYSSGMIHWEHFINETEKIEMGISLSSGEIETIRLVATIFAATVSGITPGAELSTKQLNMLDYALTQMPRYLDYLNVIDKAKVDMLKLRIDQAVKSS